MLLRLKETADTYIDWQFYHKLLKTEPRMGFTVFSGNAASRIREGRESGGYDAFPVMFQFGYQFEKQYLMEGIYQALFEFIPMITGVDQQLIVPSITILNGFRNNKHGWEVAIGPSISIASYKDLALINGKYYTEDELKKAGITQYDLKKTVDSRGQSELTSA